MRKSKKSIAQRGNREPIKSYALDILACETLVLEFLREWKEIDEEITPITEISLFEFRKFIERKRAEYSIDCGYKPMKK